MKINAAINNFKHTFHISSVFETKYVVIQLLGHVWLLLTPWTAVTTGSRVLHISWSLLKFKSIESVMLSNHLMLCHFLLLLPSIFSQSMLMLYFNRCCLKTLKDTGSVYAFLCSYQLHFPIISMTLNAICLFILQGRVALFSS